MYLCLICANDDIWTKPLEVLLQTLMFARRIKARDIWAGRRCLHSLKPSSPFKILFLGRDEFSCLVLDELHKNRGVFDLLVCILEALKPNKIYGRKYWLRHILINGLDGGALNCRSVCSPSVQHGHQSMVLLAAPLKLKAQELGLEPQLLPSKPEFRHWLVRIWISQNTFTLTDSNQPPDSSPFVSNPLDPSNVIVTASFGRLISNNLLHKFSSSRRLNVHPSLLPLYRGPAPIQRFIADGGDETGVCVVEMKEKRFAVDGGEIWGSRRMVSAFHDQSVIFFNNW